MRRGLPPENGGVQLSTTDQSTYTHHARVRLRMLGLDRRALVQVQNMLVGGGFGGKEDMSVQHHAALLAYADPPCR